MNGRRFPPFHLNDYHAPDTSVLQIRLPAEASAQAGASAGNTI